jgi:fatty acid desaturase
MTDPPRPLPNSEREARRALLHEALVELASTDHPEHAADEVLRALDAYVDGHASLEPREPPVMEFAPRGGHPAPRTPATRWNLWLAVAAALAATIAVAVTISAAKLAAIVIIGIWVVAALAMTLT